MIQLQNWTPNKIQCITFTEGSALFQQNSYNVGFLRTCIIFGPFVDLESIKARTNAR